MTIGPDPISMIFLISVLLGMMGFHTFCTDGSFRPFAVHYAETAILPAAIGEYRLCPTAESPEIKVIDASVRP